tara:strand:- start:2169 stop:2702 length:534 start_codon:yes stop_codon:yes gene_type:complete
MAKDKKIVLKDVEVCWAKLQEPDTKYMSEDLAYTVAIKMNDQLENLMTDYKLNKKVKEGKDTTFDGARFIQIGLDEKTRGGWTRYGEVYDAEGNPSEALLGNGSKVNMFISIGDSQYGNIIKLGHLSTMNQDTKEMFFDFCQITDLVEYNKTSAVITSRETIAAANTAPVEEVTIDF